jgi:hypothetical protein
LTTNAEAALRQIVMTDASSTIDRIAPTQRPAGYSAGYHRWSDLLFIHWQVRVSDLIDLLPERLTIDTYEGHAWVGLVPFHMSKVRPWWSPSVPFVSSFHETNVRTYVHLDGKDPGVWFFSLDASSALAVRIARWRWHLPYFHSEMSLKRKGDYIRYTSERSWPEQPDCSTSIDATIGDVIGAYDKDLPPGQAAPGTLEHFLAERYVLYSQRNDGRLCRGRVHHTPYPLREASLETCDQKLLDATKISHSPEPDHTLFSNGVDVEVFDLEPI